MHGIDVNQLRACLVIFVPCGLEGIGYLGGIEMDFDLLWI